jgi:hypothetical protein
VQTPTQDPALWARQIAWRAGPDAAALNRRMIEDLGIHRHTADRTLDAYIRYAYLACVTPEPVIPPAIVAETAGLHWHDRRDFVEAVLGRPLPREAFVVRPSADPGHARARALYQSTFGAPPDPHVWHARAQRWHIRALYAAGALALAGLVGMIAIGDRLSDLQLRVAVGLWAAALLGLVILAWLAPGRSREHTDYTP